MPEILGVVVGLLHRPQRRDVDELVEIGAFGGGQQPVQVGGLQHLALGQRQARRLGHIAQRIEFQRRGFFVDAEQERAFQADQFFGGGDIGEDHEFLDQPVRVEAVAERDRGDFALGRELDAAFGQVEVQGLATLARLRCGGIGGIERADDGVEQRTAAVVRIAVEGRLDLVIASGWRRTGSWRG